MNKCIMFFDKWGSVITLSLVAILLLFALGCAIYTAIINPFVGWCGIIGVTLSEVVFILSLISDIKARR